MRPIVPPRDDPAFIGMGMGSFFFDFFGFFFPPDTVSPAVSRFTYRGPRVCPSLSPHRRQKRASLSWIISPHWSHSRPSQTLPRIATVELGEVSSTTPAPSTP